jgi:gamma-polyglutamate biosynthesis protein CapA
MFKKVIIFIFLITSLNVKADDGSISILFLGDMMFDRGVGTQANKKGFEYIFGQSTTTIQKHDLTIANLEGPITTFKSKTILSSGKAIPGFQFTFATSTAKALKVAGIDIVSLANNHTINFGQIGLDQTRQSLIENNVMYFGSPINNPDLTATTTCIKDICVGIIGWHEFGYKNDEFIYSKIKEMRSIVDYLVIFPHWGIEYESKPNKKQIKLAHDWIDVGADVVVGAHPHVVQTVEKYKDKYIFYSLGNFIFDQYFSFGTTHGIGVSANISKDKVDYKIIPFSSVGSRVNVLSESDVSKIWNNLIKISGDVVKGMY